MSFDGTRFSGPVWLESLSENPELDLTVLQVTFAPGSTTHWHRHPRGQVLLVTAGEGWFQLRGQPARAIKVGDVVDIAAHQEHWHGAGPATLLQHFAIQPVQDTEWLHPATPPSPPAGEKNAPDAV